MRLALCVIVAAAAACIPAEPRADTVLENNMVITQSIVAVPGLYEFEDAEEDGALIVGANGVIIDLNGATIDGRLDVGYGIRCDGFSDVQIIGGTVRGYRVAVFLADGAGHLVANNTLSDNRERAAFHDSRDFLGVWHEWGEMVASDEIGNGLVFMRISDSVVRDNSLQRQQNGIGLFWSDRNDLLRNEASDNEGWGIHLHHSSDNLIRNNSADNAYDKQSTYCRDVQDDGCDTAALLIIKESNDNLVIGNSLRNSGDGLFLAAREGSMPWGADRNLFVANDASLAKHHAFEATFAAGNRFYQNLAVDAGRVGFWLGGSTETIVRDNEARGCAWAGIWNQGVVGIEIVNNDISENGGQGGIYLEPLAGFPPSADYVVVDNRIESNAGPGIWIADSVQTAAIIGNHVKDNPVGIRFAAEARELQATRVQFNELLCGDCSFDVENLQAGSLDLRWNWWGTTDSTAIAARIFDRFDDDGGFSDNRAARLEVVYGSGGLGPFMLRRSVATPQDDASDTEAGDHSTNAASEVYLGSSAGIFGSGTPFTAGFRFTDLYLPNDAEVLSAHLSLPTDGPHREPLELWVAAEQSSDAAPFSPLSMPRHRQPTPTRVPWQVDDHWNSLEWRDAPEIAASISEVIAGGGWRSGNTLVILVGDAGSRAARRVWAYDRDPVAERYHRFTHLELDYLYGGELFRVFERLRASPDDAGDSEDGRCNSGVADDNVHLARGDMCGGQPGLIGGFRFTEVALPPGAQATDARLQFATDGTYTTPIDLRIHGDDGAASAPFSPASMPRHRPLTAASKLWPVEESWGWMDWHASPDLSPIVTELTSRPDWTTDSPLTFIITDEASTTHRRVWGFDRDPELAGGIGMGLFEPYLKSAPHGLMRIDWLEGSGP